VRIYAIFSNFLYTKMEKFNKGLDFITKIW